MAHILLHYSLGVACVVVPAIPNLVRQVRMGRSLSRWIGLRLILAHALGVFATIPGILPVLGVPESWCSGWWMNVFLFHPLLDHLKPGGALIAEMVTVALVALQYAMLLYALAARELSVREASPRPP